MSFLEDKSFEQGKSQKVNDKNILGYTILFAVFMAGLCSNVIIAGKVAMFLGFAVPASVFVWAMTFPISDIVTEVYGFRYARRLIIGSFFGFLAVYLFMWMAVVMPPANFWDKQPEFEMFFNTGGRIVAAAVLSYTITQTFDVYAFAYIKRLTGPKYLWIRNNVSTLLSQTLSNTIFLLVAFTGVLEWDNWWTLFVGNLSVRYILALSDTILVYAGVGLLYKFYPELRG